MPVPRTQLAPTLNDLYDHLDSLGQVVSSSVASGSAVALTSTTPASVTSITLTEGDWTVFGVTAFLPAATTSITSYTGGASGVSATLGAVGDYFTFTTNAVVPGAVGQIFANPVTRVVVPAGQSVTIYLVARATFTVSTLGAYGSISARRMSK